MEHLTSEQIAQHYKAMLDSVNLINSYVAFAPVQLTEKERNDAVDRNVRHLEIMRAKDFWTTEDMAPIDAAIATGKAFLQGVSV